MKQKLPHIKYRPEVDGLRAIAVLSVIFYHLDLYIGNNQILKGGFLGVDVFFVISGYLITQILLFENAHEKGFSVLRFYERRIRRLLPALFTVTIVSLPFAWNFLLPDQLINYSKSIISSLFFVSNFFWLDNLQQYDAESALLQPFLHTWSLAVEEQFYIFYPFLLMLLYSLNQKKIFLILLFLGVIGLLLSHITTNINQSISFYMLPTRLWELLCGGLLAFTVYPLSHKFNQLAKFLLPVGIIILIGSMFYIDFNNSHPGLITLLPVTGTMTIILFAKGSELTTKLLSCKPMIGIGLISYSLYLWHYPVFAFGRLLAGVPSGIEKVIWLFITFLLSVLTYYFIEKPFRNKTNFSFSNVLYILSFIFIFILLINWFLIKNNGFSSRLGYYNSLLQISKQVWVEQNGERCHSGGRGGKTDMALSESCFFNYGTNDKNIILIGDSHAASISEEVRKLSQENAYNFIQVTKAGCPHIVGFQRNKCRVRSNNLLNFIKNFTNPIIIYNSRIPLFLEQSRYISEIGEKEAGYKNIPQNKIDDEFFVRAKALQKTLVDLSQNSSKLILIYPVPEQGFHLKDKLFQLIRFSKNTENLPIISSSYKQFKSRVERSYQVLDEIDGDNIYRVYPENIFCNNFVEDRCIVSNKNNFYFEKDNHVSPLGAKLIINEIKKLEVF